jgi:hypothetical protein
MGIKQYSYEAHMEIYDSGIVDVEEIFDEDGELCEEEMRERAEELAYEVAEHNMFPAHGDLFVSIG